MELTDSKFSSILDSIDVIDTVSPEGRISQSSVWLLKQPDWKDRWENFVLSGLKIIAPYKLKLLDLRETRF